MRKALIVAAAMTLGASTADAQLAQQCASGSTGSQDACQKAVDVFNYLAPQLGTIVAGGNTTLGQGGTLGGLPHFTLSLRANAIHGSVPKVDAITPSTLGANADTYETSAYPLGLPSVDGALGVFGGIPLPLTKVGGVDLLLNASYLPDVSTDGIDVSTTGGALKFGYGVRVGLLQESLVVPGVSVSYMKRDLPTMNLVGSSGDDTIAVRNLGVKTDAWRLVASKSFLAFGLAAGVGQDQYKSAAQLDVTVNDVGCPGGTCSGTPFTFDQKVKRTNYFLDLSLNMMIAKFVGEIGMVSGGDIPTYNQFDGKKADDARLYGSVGFRIGL